MAIIKDDFDIKTFQRSLIEETLREIKDIEEAVRSGKLKGNWEVKEINEPNTKGYIAHGQFWSDTPVEPFNPSNPPWLPRRPVRPLPKPSFDKIQEPLTDIFEDRKTVKLYVHIPGVEKNDIQFNVSDGVAEVKAKNFYTKLNLPTADVKPDKIKATYKNGVLEAVIPKKRVVKGKRENRIKIE